MNRMLCLLCLVVLLQSALLWKLCKLHQALLTDVACVPVLVVQDDSGGEPRFTAPDRIEGPAL